MAWSTQVQMQTSTMDSSASVSSQRLSFSSSDSSTPRIAIEHDFSHPYSSRRDLKASKKPHSDHGAPLEKASNVSALTASSSGEDGSSDNDSLSDPDDADEEDEPDLNAPPHGSGKIHHGTGLLQVSQGKKRKLSMTSTASTNSDGIRLPVLSKHDRPKTKFQKLAESNHMPGMPSTDVDQETNDDDDELYNAVDLISDSDEDEPEVEKFEEEAIIEEEEHPRAESPTSSTLWNGFDFDDDLLLEETSPLFGDITNMLGLDDAMEASQPSNAENVIQDMLDSRHVHFQDDVREYSDSNSSASSNEDDFFPDLFVDENSLDPSFRRDIENAVAMDDQVSSDESSFWDTDGDEELALEVQALADDSSDDGSSSCGNSSGYETDLGDTTDEELPPPETISLPRANLRRESSSSLTPEVETPKATSTQQTKSKNAEKLSTETKKKKKKAAAAAKKGPSLGSWVADPTKPIAVIDSTGKRMLIYPAKTPPKSDSWSAATSGQSSPVIGSARSNSHGLFDDSENDRSDVSNDLASPMLSSGINLMMSGLFQGAPGEESLRGGQVLGPPEAFYPFKDVGLDGRVVDEEEEDNSDLSDAAAVLNVHEFVDFGGFSDSETEIRGQEDNDVTPRPSTGSVLQNSSTFKTPSKHNVEASELLERIRVTGVTSFRSNQSRHQSLLRRPPHREFLPAGSRMRGHSAIKFGRQAGANSPISPMRRRRSSTKSLPTRRRVSIN